MKRMIQISLDQARHFRLRRSGLLEPFASPEVVASALAGVQAQILPSAGLALWNRSSGLSHAAFDRLLHEQRTLVKLWGQRGTLHLYPSSEWPLIYAALNHRPSWWRRQAARNGALADHEALVAQVAALLHERRMISRADLRAAGIALSDELLSSWGGIFADLVRLGLACHAGQLNGEGLFAAREHWLPELAWEPPPADEANVALARRYFWAYGPATAQDFAYWRGAAVGDARRWLSVLAPELTEIVVEGQPLLALQEDLELLAAPAPERWPVLMLGRFDPLLLGLKQKDWIVAPAYYKLVWRPAGHIEGTILAGGRAVATWRYERRPGGLDVLVTPFKPLPARVRNVVERRAAQVAAFFGLPLASVSWPPRSG